MEKIALVGNFPPRKCGIATFTNDLNDGIRTNNIATSVIAMNDGVNKYKYPTDVEFEIEQNEITYYINAANFINTHHFDAVILQHEFGIYGGPDGRNIVQLLKRIKKPVITTLHTILDTPSEGQRAVVNEIAHLSKKLISISKKGIDILKNTYGIPISKCEHIHHGVHQADIRNINAIKRKIGVMNKRVLLTFGLLSRNKSIEVVINALPNVVKKYPDVVYIVLGATHPHVVKYEGEEYRNSLIRLVKKLGLERNVLFIDRFVSNKQLFEFLKICDIYVIPYLGEKQISSGTLIYAMGAGKPVISTPFWYAEEMLADGRGMLFNFNDSKLLSKKITYLFDNESEKETIATNAFDLAGKCYWPNIGKKYIDLLKTITPEKTQSKNKQVKKKITKPTIDLPPINLKQLRILTDSTGILQHSRYNIPNREHGYCIDDNARALILCTMLEKNIQDTDELDRFTSTYLSFIDYAWNTENKRFRNFMSYDRHWLEEKGSQDSAARTMWALGYTAAHTSNSNFYHHSNHLFRQGLENIEYISHPRAVAYLILGLVNYARMHHENDVIELLEKKAKQLSDYFNDCIGCNEWQWFDNVITYANNRIPQALISAGLFLKKPELANRGLKILDWLIEKQFIDNIFTPIGNNGWMTPENKVTFDQQPLEAHGMIDACMIGEEYKKDGKYAEHAIKAFEWFTGNNVNSSIVHDLSTGGCRDGLHANGVNLNQGAESTLSWLMSLVSMKNYLKNKSKQT